MRLFLIVSSFLLFLINISMAEELQTIFNLKEFLGKKTIKVSTIKDYFHGEKLVKLTLKDLGFDKDIILQGVAPAYTFKIPIFDEFEEAQITFYVEFIGRISPRSFITVLIDGIPQKNYKITGNTLSLTLPIKKYKKDFIELTLSFILYEPENICDFINDQSIYAIIKNESFISIKTKSVEEKKLKSFLIKYNPKFKVIGSSIDLANFSYLISRTFANYSIYNLSFGEGKEVRIGNFKNSFVENGTLFLAREHLNALKFPFLLETEKIEKVSEYLAKKEKKIPFSAFGYKTSTYTGYGTLTFTVPFYVNGGKPRRTILYLKYAHSYILDAGFFELRINNSLVFSEPLKGISTIKEKILEIDSSVLNYGPNILSIIFRYYLGSDVCKGTVPQMSVTVFDDSFFEFSGENREFLTVSDFINGIGGVVKIHASNEANQFLLEFFKLLGYINKKIDFFSERDGDYLISIEPYDKSKTFFIYDASTGQKIFEFKGDYEFLVFQLAKKEGNPALLINYTSPEALNYIKSISKEDLNRFVSNTIFITKDNIYALDIGKKFRIEYTYTTKFKLYMKKLKFLFLIIAIGIITAILIYIWRRLT